MPIQILIKSYLVNFGDSWKEIQNIYRSKTSINHKVLTKVFLSWELAICSRNLKHFYVYSPHVHDYFIFNIWEVMVVVNAKFSWFSLFTGRFLLSPWKVIWEQISIDLNVELSFALPLLKRAFIKITNTLELFLEYGKNTVKLKNLQYVKEQRLKFHNCLMLTSVLSFYTWQGRRRRNNEFRAA